MGRIRVSIRADGLAAETAADAGPSCTREQIAAALRDAGVTAGIDDGALTAFVEAAAREQPVPAAVIARGQPPVPGVDGRIERTVAIGPTVGRRHGDDQLDYHERDLLHPATAGTTLGRIVPPTASTAGLDVRGRRIDAKAGRPHGVRLGAGVQVEGELVIAARDGVVVQDARQIDVVTAWQHGGDVDLRSGNLHTDGSLAVRGDVTAGFAASAGGDLAVGGSVQRGAVTAGGSVHVTGSILDNSVVEAHGNVVCRQASSSRIAAGLTATILGDATHCVVSAEEIRVVAGRGVAFGGELRARNSITLRTAGTANGAATLLSVADLLDESAELVRAAGQETKIDRAAMRSRRDGGGPSGKAVRIALKVDDAAQQQRLLLAQRQRELLRTATIQVDGAIHAGVRIRFGKKTLTVESPRAHVRFRWDAEQNEILEEDLP